MTIDPEGTRLPSLPHITIGVDGSFRRDGVPIKVTLKKDRIKVGCHDISICAAKKIMTEWDKHFGQQREEVEI